jgi:hypothetical protein
MEGREEKGRRMWRFMVLGRKVLPFQVILFVRFAEVFVEMSGD